jgi:Ca2+-binding RTX toxin-like protein
VGTAACLLCPSSAGAAKVLEYLFDDASTAQAIDTSGNNLHGAFVGSDIHIEPGLTSHGNAVALNGIDDFINVGDPSALNIANSYTLMGWIKYDPTDERRAELMEKGGAYWLNVRLHLRDGTADTRQARAGGYFNTCDEAGDRFQTLDSRDPIPANTWTHLASTYDGSQLKIYVNGQLVNQKAIPGPVCTNDNPLAVGAKFIPGVENINFVDGMLDDVRVYNNALSEAQIQVLMAGGPAAGVLQFSAATYQVNEGAGNATITVTRTGGSSGPVSVSYATSDGTATEGADYSFSQGVLSWGAGDSSNKSFQVSILNDTDPEGDETINLTLSNPDGGATLGTPQAAGLTIARNDQPTGSCQGVAATQVGTSGNDTLKGTSGSDVIAGLGSNDIINGLGGHDRLCGDGGNDELNGGGGHDALNGNHGDDALNGGTGTDTCNGGSGSGDTRTACETVTGVP